VIHGGQLRLPASRVRLAAHAPIRKAGREQGFDALRIHCNYFRFVRFAAAFAKSCFTRSFTMRFIKS
jgi:hypothetical protein